MAEFHIHYNGFTLPEAIFPDLLSAKRYIERELRKDPNAERSLFIVRATA